MKVRFGEIPEGGVRFEISEASWFPDRELQRSGPVRSVVSLKRDSGDRVLLTGEIETTISFDCDRCAENFNLELQNGFRLDIEYAPTIKMEAAEHECRSAEMDVLYVQEPVVDIFEILHQQVFLMIPEKHLCGDSCRGLCPRCGVNLNLEKCQCRNDPDSSPFAILKR